MTLSDRDKKILMVLVPLLLVGAFWFLLLAPKREEAATLGDELAQVEAERDQAEALANEAESTKSNYAQDYATVVRLGKAIPSEVDMPSLIVQLDEAAKDTDIRFVRVAAGEREAAPVAPPPSETPPPASEAGGEEATTGPGTAVETANEGAAAADAQAGAPPPEPGAPAAAPGAPAADGTSGAPGLESIPLSFSFQGSFFELADFFHEMKRFVRLAGDGVRVNGRLLTIDSFTFASEEFPTIAAEVEASVYLSPKTEGATAGADPAGPPATAAAAPSTTPPAAPAPAASTEATQ